MARLPRLALAGHTHWVVQLSHQALTPFVDEQDRMQYLAALQLAAQQEDVQLLAYALCDGAVHLLLTPREGPSLGRLMQAVGRRYVSAHHRRHGGSGTLWNGRFRCAVVEPGATLLEVLCFIDSQGADISRTGQRHRTVGETASPAVPALADPPAYWALGNTPFDRQAAWRQRLADGLNPARTDALLKAALGSWAVGSAAFAQTVAEAAARPAAPRPRGRPRRTAA
ncbi:MAG: transposase [Rubrivivax sp.]|nr:transposase [Rubrivivax sp.]